MRFAGSPYIDQRVRATHRNTFRSPLRYTGFDPFFPGSDENPPRPGLASPGVEPAKFLSDGEVGKSSLRSFESNLFPGRPGRMDARRIIIFSAYARLPLDNRSFGQDNWKANL